MAKLLYISNSRIPTTKAHGVQIVKMCEALLESGTDLKLIIPKRENSIKESPEKYYGLRVTVPTLKLPVVDIFWLTPGLLAYYIESLSFYSQVFFLTLFNQKINIFTRDHYSPLFCFGRSRVIWEVHELPSTKLGKFLTSLLGKSCRLIVAPNKAVKKYFSQDKVLYLPNAVDLKAYQNISESPLQARKLLGLPKQNKLIGYVGSLYQRKGVDTLVKAATRFSKDRQLVIYGGPSLEFQRIATLIKGTAADGKVLLYPSVPYRQIPLILRAMDVLLIPNSPTDLLASTETSPLKFREYLASGKPIVASNVPSLQELDPKSGQVKFFTAGDPASLTITIDLALKEKVNYCVDDNISLKTRVKKLLKYLE